MSHPVSATEPIPFSDFKAYLGSTSSLAISCGLSENLKNSKIASLAVVLSASLHPEMFQAGNPKVEQSLDIPTEDPMTSRKRKP